MLLNFYSSRQTNPKARPQPTPSPSPAHPRAHPLHTEVQDLGDTGLKEAESSSGVFSENLNLEAYEGV